MITKTYNNISKKEYYIKFFELFNVMQSNKEKRLTEKQILILSEFMNLDNSYKFTRFKQLGKNKVIEYFKSIGDPLTSQNIDVTLSNLKKKGILVEQTDRVKYLNPNIEKYLISDNKEFVFKFNTNE